MSTLDDYANKYQSDPHGAARRHPADDAAHRWRPAALGLSGRMASCPRRFTMSARDRDNRVVILTGTGAEFSGPRATPGTSSFPSRPPTERIDRIHWEGRHLLMRLLEIEVPVISAINGPAWRHSEIPLLGDIVLAADTAQFQDSAHFASDVVPGDGMHIVMPLLLGMNRGRYLPPDRPDPRRSEGARARPRRRGAAARQAAGAGLGTGRGPRQEGRPCCLRYTRLLLTEALRRQMHDLLGYGLGMELLALGEKPEGPA